MDKKVMNDIKPRRSIRDIATRKHVHMHQDHIPGEERQERTKRRSSLALWIAVGFFALFLFFVFSLAFSGSKIVAHPEEATVSIDGVYEAQKVAADGMLPYEIMTVTKEGSKEVEPTGESFVEERASGTIKVFNDFDEEVQRLIANTRFESPDGKIYRIREPISIPGKVGSTPGSVSVRVWAEEPGEEYNIEKGVRFTIPGLAGGDRFDAFWAESETSIDGGFRGVTQTVSPEDKESAESEIQESLRTQILQDTYAQTPQNFILFEEALKVDFEPLTNETAENGKVKVRQKAIVQAVIFNEGELASFFANRLLPEYNGESVQIANMDDLTFTLEEPESFPEAMNESFPFSLTGTAHFVWQFDKADLAGDLVGASKSDIDRILMNYPSIERAEVVLRPFWRRSFPDKVDEITIRTVIDKQ